MWRYLVVSLWRLLPEATIPVAELYDKKEIISIVIKTHLSVLWMFMNEDNWVLRVNSIIRETGGEERRAAHVALLLSIFNVFAANCFKTIDTNSAPCTCTP